MNVFGAFTFGSLIKTFIPGFVWLVALWLLWGGLAAALPALTQRPALDTVLTQNSLVVAIPVAIVLGLLSNIIAFMGVNDVLIRDPVRRRTPDLFRLYDQIAGRIRHHFRDKLAFGDAALDRGFDSHADAELLLLQTIGMTHLAYVREQYWYHMEFQVNLLLATATGLLGLLLEQVPRTMGSEFHSAAEWAGVDILLVGGACWFLLRAARKNYRRHVAKMTSVMAAALVGLLAPPPAAA